MAQETLGYEVRTIRLIIDCDMGLNPTAFSVVLMQDNELVSEQMDYAEPYDNLYQVVFKALQEASKQCVWNEWWR